MSHSPPRPTSIDGSGLRIGIVAARYNPDLVDALLEAACGTLRAAAVPDGSVEVWRVPGSNEIPVAVQGMVFRGGCDAVIALGVIVRGGTIHYEVISHATASALIDVSLAAAVPVINGIVVAETEEQARERCSGNMNRGGEFAVAAVEMAALRREKFR